MHLPQLRLQCRFRRLPHSHLRIHQRLQLLPFRRPSYLRYCHLQKQHLVSMHGSRRVAFRAVQSWHIALVKCLLARTSSRQAFPSRVVKFDHVVLDRGDSHPSRFESPLLRHLLRQNLLDCRECLWTQSLSEI